MAVGQAKTEQGNRGRHPKKAKGSKKNDKQIVMVLDVPPKPESHKRKRANGDNLYDNEEVTNAIMKRAEEVQANLSSKYPSFIKCMLPSHVTGGFWLGFPKQFCDKHLPKEDTQIYLEDEKGLLFPTKYLREKIGLGGGWRWFSIAHELSAGDAVIFHLVEPNTFKVYILRVNGSEEVDGALSLLGLDFCKLLKVKTTSIKHKDLKDLILWKWFHHL